MNVSSVKYRDNMTTDITAAVNRFIGGTDLGNNH
jgi:hypothetical protein